MLNPKILQALDEHAPPMARSQNFGLLPSNPGVQIIQEQVGGGFIAELSIKQNVVTHQRPQTIVKNGMVLQVEDPVDLDEKKSYRTLIATFSVTDQGFSLIAPPKIRLNLVTADGHNLTPVPPRKPTVATSERPEPVLPAPPI